jgi:hypothetical protein
MFYGVAITLWLLGLWFTYDAMTIVGASNPLITAFIVQVILSFGQSLIVNEKYKTLPQTQQKIILVFAVVFIGLDVWLNYRGLTGKLGNLHAIMPVQIQQQIEVSMFNNIAQWFAAVGISVLAEILFNVGKSNRIRAGQIQ